MFGHSPISISTRPPLLPSINSINFPPQKAKIENDKSHIYFNIISITSIWCMHIVYGFFCFSPPLPFFPVCLRERFFSLWYTARAMNIYLSSFCVPHFVVVWPYEYMPVVNTDWMPFLPLPSRSRHHLPFSLYIFFPSLKFSRIHLHRMLAGICIILHSSFLRWMWWSDACLVGSTHTHTSSERKLIAYFFITRKRPLKGIRKHNEDRGGKKSSHKQKVKWTWDALTSAKKTAYIEQPFNQRPWAWSKKKRWLKNKQFNLNRKQQ